jgi:hypothetical protein
MARSHEQFSLATAGSQPPASRLRVLWRFRRALHLNPAIDLTAGQEQPTCFQDLEGVFEVDVSCSVGDYDQIKGVLVEAKEVRRDDRLVQPNETFTLRIPWASPNEHRMPTFSSQVNRLRRHMSSSTSSKAPKLPHTQSKRSLRCKITTATKELALAMAEHVALVISRFPLHLGKCQCLKCSSPYSQADFDSWPRSSNRKLSSF